MPIIVLIRHGENEFVKKGRLAGRLPGVHLNDKGNAQAQVVADFLSNKLAEVPIKAIYSSPLERAMETAAPLAKALGVEVIQRHGLIETDCGEWQGKTLKSLNRQKIWKVVQQTPSIFTFPGGETFRDTQHRIVNEIQELANQHELNDVIICVSHSDPIRLAIAYFLGLSMDMFQRLIVAPASINVLTLSPHGAGLLALNYSTEFAFPKPTDKEKPASGNGKSEKMDKG